MQYVAACSGHHGAPVGSEWIWFFNSQALRVELTWFLFAMSTKIIDNVSRLFDETGDRSAPRYANQHFQTTVQRDLLMSVESRCS
jgi:hypothetical protein